MIRKYDETDLESTAHVWLRSGQEEYHYLPKFQELDETKAVDIFRLIIQD